MTDLMNEDGAMLRRVSRSRHLHMSLPSSAWAIHIFVLLASSGALSQAPPPPLMNESEDVDASGDEVAPDGVDLGPDADADAPDAAEADRPSTRGPEEEDALASPRKKRAKRERRKKRKRPRQKRPPKKVERAEDPIPGIMLHGVALGTTAFVGGVGSMAVVGIGPAFAVNAFLHQGGLGLVSTEEAWPTLLAYGAIFAAPAVAAVVTVVAVGLVQGLFVPGVLEQSLIGVFSGVVVVVLSAIAGLVALLAGGFLGLLIGFDASFTGGTFPRTYWSDVALATVVFSTVGVAVTSLVAGGIGMWSGYAALDDPQE